MYYITQMQRPSYEKGQREGKKEGKKEGEKEGKKEGEKIGEKKGIAKIISRLIAKKFDSEVKKELPRLRNLPQDDLMELAEQILIFSSLSAVHEWIYKRKQMNKKK